jgi:hypothetical protein
MCVVLEVLAFVYIPCSRLLRPKHALFALSLLIVLLAIPSVHASVSIEYLGPYPLNPTPVPGHDRTLSDSYTVGNAGSEQTIISMTVSSTDPDFGTHFTVTFSDNMFILDPGVRKGVTATFVFDSGTPVHDYSADIEIVASVLHYPPGSNPGHATFDLPIAIKSDLLPPVTTTSTSTSTTSTTSSTTGQCILDAPGNANACVGVSAGTFSGLTAVAVSSIPTPPPAAAGTFPVGLFSFTVSGLSPGQTVTVTITLSSPLPAGTFSYWKFQGGAWVRFPSASLDPTRMIITLRFIVPAGSTSISDPGGPTISSPPITTTQTQTTTTQSSSTTTVSSSTTTGASPLMYITVTTYPLAFGNPQGGGTHPAGSVITISVENVPGYTFTKWQRDGTDYTSQQSFTYTVDASRTFTAIFEATSSISLIGQATSSTSLIGVIITSAPAGLGLVAVDGTPVATPHVVTWVPGSSHTLSASPVSEPNGVQYVWISWSDGGAQSHIVAPSTSTTYTANFEVQAQTATIQVASSSAPTSPQVMPLSTNPSSKCIIATAAYGSEMAPEVAYMRYVRDSLIGSTPTGKTLRDAFNAFYYSWSPPVAATVAQSSDLQALFRILLLPIVAIVHATAWVFTTFGSADFASVVAFGVAAVLCVGTYIFLPVLAIRGAWKRIRLRQRLRFRQHT